MRGEHSIHINQFDALYSIPRGMENAAGIQRRFDAIAADLLPKVWDERINRMASEEAIYFIERVEVAVNLDLAESIDRNLADAWAAGLQQGIVRTINRNEGGVIVFRNRAEYLASFAQDLLRGVAWDRWYYDELRDTSGRGTGQLLADLLGADSDTGREALTELASRGDLDLLLASLNDSDADRLVARCLLPPGPGISFSHMYRAWVDALRPLLTGFVPTTPARDLARLYLRLIVSRPELGPDVNLARFIGDLLSLRGRLASSGGERMIRMLESDGLDDMVDGYDRSREGNLLRDLARELSGREAGKVLRDLGAAAPSPSRIITTRLGGLYLLVPAMLDLGIEEFAAELEEEEVGSTGYVLELLALAAIGLESARSMKGDRGLAFFAGLERPRTEEERIGYRTRALALLEKSTRLSTMLVDEEQSNADDAALDALSLWSESDPIIDDRELDRLIGRLTWRVLDHFSSRLGAFAGSTPAYLRRNFFESYAEIEITDERIAIHFLTCPLGMVLRMAGFENMTPAPAWLGGRTLEYHLER